MISDAADRRPPFWMIDADPSGNSGTLRLFSRSGPVWLIDGSPGLTWVTLVSLLLLSRPIPFLIRCCPTWVCCTRLSATSWPTSWKGDDRRAGAGSGLRHVVIPPPTPLVVFITLIQLMDNFRVFEPIVGFWPTDETAPPFSWFIHADLRSSDAAVHRAADSVRRRAVDAYSPRSRAADGRELYAVQMY